MNFTTDAIDLIKEFEGLELTAYPDPGNPITGDPWTLGYGHTSGVQRGDTCTPEQAEIWLIDDMEWADAAVVDYVRVDLEQCCFDCLVSFVYNIGPTAFGESTLVRRLNNGEPQVKAIEEELPRWVNGASGPLPGLVRRREAEVALAQKCKKNQVEAPDNSPAPISVVDAAEYYNGLSHQIRAFEYLEDLLTVEELDQFGSLYRNADKSERILQAPYYYQLDSITPEGFRMCFSSTNAMALEYLQPGTLSSATGDDEYLARVHQFGDTTDAAAQVAALRSYGIDCEFIMNGSFDLLEEQLQKGLPIPCGWLQKGHVSSPQGGGHWSLVVGTEGSDMVIHDPFGEVSLTGGYYVSQAPTAGRFVRYSRKNWGPRWEVEGPGSGWMIRIF